MAIVGKASNASILDGMLFCRKRVEKMFTVDDPMKTIGAPVRIGRPMVNLIWLWFELAGFHGRILARCALQLIRVIGWPNTAEIRSGKSPTAGSVFGS